MFRDRLKELRSSMNLSQTKMADAMGTTLKTYQNYENGETSPNVERLTPLVDFGVNIHWLLTGIGDARLHEGGAVAAVYGAGNRPRQTFAHKVLKAEERERMESLMKALSVGEALMEQDVPETDAEMFGYLVNSLVEANAAARQISSVREIAEAAFHVWMDIQATGRTGDAKLQLIDRRVGQALERLIRTRNERVHGVKS